jgi:hypothetical protein
MKGCFLETNGQVIKLIVVKSANLLAAKHVLLSFYLTHFS